MPPQAGKAQLILQFYAGLEPKLNRWAPDASRPMQHIVPGAHWSLACAKGDTQCGSRGHGLLHRSERLPPCEARDGSHEDDSDDDGWSNEAPRGVQMKEGGNVNGITYHAV